MDNPSHGWTVASLAAAARMSRAAFARRFTELVGEPPMTFLAGWRLAMAADLLRDTDATLDTVARNVGYSSPFALSTAFKRVHGVSPQEHRRALTTSATDSSGYTTTRIGRPRLSTSPPPSTSVTPSAHLRADHAAASASRTSSRRAPLAGRPAQLPGRSSG